MIRPTQTNGRKNLKKVAQEYKYSKACLSPGKLSVVQSAFALGPQNMSLLTLDAKGVQEFLYIEEGKITGG